MHPKPNLRAMPPPNEPGPAAAPAPAAATGADYQVVGRSIGDLMREARGLTAGQVEQILAYQRQHNMHFGEAAVALKLASRDDVLWALAQQFQYPYAPAGEVPALHNDLITAIDPFSEESEMFATCAASC